MRPYTPRLDIVPTRNGYYGQMRETIRRIGTAIKRASIHPPIRNYTAALASKAGPKDFMGQLRSVYDAFIKNWRYVRDPASRELLTNSPEAIWRLTIGGDGIGVGAGKGAGDCDCAAAALGAQLESIGFKTRLGTTAKSHKPGRLFEHVFVQANIPGRGWVTLDPVLHPKEPFGAIAKHSRIAFWDLKGNLIGYSGNVAGALNGVQEEESMLHGPNLEEWPDMGFGQVSAGGEPQEWSTMGLNNWGWMDTPQGRVSTIGLYGYIDGCQLSGLSVEVDENDEWEPGTVRTPMLELSLGDYQYMTQNQEPYDGMLALGDTGEPYVYDGTLGFFKKLFRRIKRGVRKVGRRIKKGIRKVLKRSKFGRFLLKVGGKIKKIAMKIVRPLMKFVGKWAGKLAPIAAMIPGYGTAIAAALAAAGKVAKIMTKFSVKTKGKKGTVRGLKFKNPKAAPAFAKTLKREAAGMQRLRKRNPARFRALLHKIKKAGAR